MINRLVIQHACEERGVAVTADEVNQEIVQIAGKFNLAVDNWFQMLQAEKNITPQQMADLVSFIKNWRYLDGSVPVGGE